MADRKPIETSPKAGRKVQVFWTDAAGQETSFMTKHPEMPSYTTATAGIVGLTKGLAGRLGKDRIRVNAVAPGWVKTQRQRELWTTDDALAAHVARQPLRKRCGRKIPAC